MLPRRFFGKVQDLQSLHGERIATYGSINDNTMLPLYPKIIRFQSGLKLFIPNVTPWNNCISGKTDMKPASLSCHYETNNLRGYIMQLCDTMKRII